MEINSLNKLFKSEYFYLTTKTKKLFSTFTILINAFHRTKIVYNNIFIKNEIYFYTTCS